MADVQISSNESQEDLVGFFTGFNDLLEQLDSDADNFVTEYLERKLEDYVTILLGMIWIWLTVFQLSAQSTDVIKDLSYDRIHNFLAYSISPLRFDRNTDTDN